MLKTKTKKSQLLLIVPPCNLVMCETLLLNNYEIRIYQEKYLKMWHEDESVNTVSIVSLLTMFSSKYHGIITHFFQNGPVIYRMFFNFVSMITFFTPSHILTLLLSMIKVYSNVFITVDQINSFISDYSLNKNVYEDVMKYLNIHSSTRDNVSYPLKDFRDYIECSREFMNLVIGFKNEMIKYIITMDIYNDIKNRIAFYYTHPLSTPPPPETCISKCYRRLTSQRYDPYYYDYCLPKPGYDGMDNFMLMVRQKFGYSVRCPTFACVKNNLILPQTSKCSTKSEIIAVTASDSQK